MRSKCGLVFKAQTQCIVVLDQRVERSFQWIRNQRFVRRQQYGLVPVMCRRNIRLEERVLDGQHRR
ncbi:hypothetical protein D3C76_1617120 [compost metagenome]